MPPGQYYVTEQISKKSYSMTVTDKGNMILGPAPEGVTVTVTGTATTTAGATTTGATTAAGLTSGLNNAGTNAAVGAGVGKASQFIPTLKNPAMDAMMRQGIQQGTQQIQNMMTK